MSERFDWMDDPEVTLLDGDPIPEEMDFPVEPPPQIGRVRAAYTTLTNDNPLHSHIKRLMIVLGIYVVCAPADPSFATNAGRVGHNSDPWIIGAILAVLSLPLTLHFTSAPVPNWSALVGELGLVKYIFGSRRDIIKKAVLFEFQNAVDLYSYTQGSYKHGVFARTSYRYVWRDVQGKCVFRISDQFDSVKSSNELELAIAAETFWTHYLFKAINTELEEQGAVHFKVNKKDWVKVGPGFMEFHFKGQTARMAVEDIEDLQINDGQFSIRSNDAGWFGGKGKYGFAFGRMANARLFLTCLEQLCGYSLE